MMKLFVPVESKSLDVPVCSSFYKAQDGSVTENIEKFMSRKLSILAEIHPGFHNHGGDKE